MYDILDHRGRRATLYEVKGSLSRRDSDLSPDLLARLRRIGLGYNAMLTLTAGCVACAGFAIAGWAGVPEPWAHAIVWPSALVVVFVVLVRWPPKRTILRTAALLLDHHRCAACGYSLAGAVPEQDGCCVCPECGAAWRVEGAP